MTKEKGVFEIRDIESFIYMYKEELQDGGYPVEVEIWDTVGQEKYDEKYLYDQKYN
jgi:GTPase SAR1 family protein